MSKAFSSNETRGSPRSPSSSFEEKLQRRSARQSLCHRKHHLEPKTWLLSSMVVVPFSFLSELRRPLAHLGVQVTAQEAEATNGARGPIIGERDTSSRRPLAEEQAKSTLKNAKKLGSVPGVFDRSEQKQRSFRCLEQRLVFPLTKIGTPERMKAPAAGDQRVPMDRWPGLCQAPC